MPSAVLLALWLYVGSVVLGIGASATSYAAWQAIFDLPALVKILVIALVCAWIFVVRQVYGGRNWARWLISIFVLLAAPKAIHHAVTQFSVAPLMITVGALLYVLKVTSVVLLFMPQSNLWYRRVTEAPVTS